MMNRAVITIVLAELMGTSLWFSGNNAIAEIASLWQLNTVEQAWLLMAAQIGFIVGTTFFAISGWADRFRAHHIFFISCLIGAFSNIGFIHASSGLSSALIYRLITGLALAGIYPTGMKLMISWVGDRTELALGWLVGALTIGTSVPYLVRAVEGSQWRTAVVASSVLATTGGLIIFMLGEGIHSRRGQRVRWGTILEVFRVRGFRLSALAYCGHMWELYAFWALVPKLIARSCFNQLSPDSTVWMFSFLVIGLGAAGCIVGGWIALQQGSARVAFYALLASFLLCMIYPFLGTIHPYAAACILALWGIAVVADSPQFASLSANAVEAHKVGSALAVQNALGFSVTLISIQLTTWIWPLVHEWAVLFLAPGPLLGLLALSGWWTYRRTRI